LYTFVIVSDETKLGKLVPFRLSEATFERIIAAAKRRGIKRPEYIRQAIAAQLERDEAAVFCPAITPEQSAQLQKLAALADLQVDVESVLDRALRAAGEPLLARCDAA
jgi:predicted DNA-binding protein